MKLIEKKTTEVDRLIEEDYTLILPTGSTEQHGPHLPLDTDIYIAEQVALKAAIGGWSVVLPPLQYGYNQKELMFPGTVSLSAKTFLNVIVDIGRSLKRQNWRRLLILNGHGWNNDILKMAVHVLNEEKGFTAACCSYWSLCSEIVNKTRSSIVPGGMAHACEFETSLMLFLRPDSVDVGQIRDEISFKWSKQHHHDLFVKSPVFIPESFELLSKSGVIGSPTHATKEKGKIWFDTTVKELNDFLKEYRNMYPRNGSFGGNSCVG